MSNSKQNIALNEQVLHYAFGMPMPGRSYTSESYRFGFNGMEKDDEMKGSGNSLDFGARIYDSRLGRWLSTDPLEAKYPDISPYTFALNNPIALIDPDGRDVQGYKNIANQGFSNAIKLASNSSIYTNTLKKLDQISNVQILYRTANLGSNDSKGRTDVLLSGSGENSRIFIVVTLNQNILDDIETANEVGATTLIHETINHVEKLADDIVIQKNSGSTNEEIYNNINSRANELEEEHHKDFSDPNSKVNQAFKEVIDKTKGGNAGFTDGVQEGIDYRFGLGDNKVKAPKNSSSNKMVDIVNQHNEQHGSEVVFKKTKTTVSKK